MIIVPNGMEMLSLQIPSVVNIGPHGVSVNKVTPSSNKEAFHDINRNLPWAIG